MPFVIALTIIYFIGFLIFKEVDLGEPHEALFFRVVPVLLLVGLVAILANLAKG